MNNSTGLMAASLMLASATAVAGGSFSTKRYDGAPQTYEAAQKQAATFYSQPAAAPTVEPEIVGSYGDMVSTQASYPAQVAPVHPSTNANKLAQMAQAAVVPSNPRPAPTVVYVDNDKPPESYGGWMQQIGRYNAQYHKDVGAIISANSGNQNWQRVPQNNGGVIVASYSPSQQPTPSRSPSASSYDSMIALAAARHGIARGLVKAVMHTESSFNRFARSPVGAQGLMQLMPATARRFNVSDSYDPEQNINAGAQYLSWLLKRFKGNEQLALAGYNAGEGNVDKYRGIPPFKETQNYVRSVMSRYHSLYSGM